MSIVRQCVYCGARATTRDHVIPHSKRKAIRRPFQNVVWACHSCNNAKGDQWPEIFFRKHPERAREFAKRAGAVDPAIRAAAMRAGEGEDLTNRVRGSSTDTRCAKAPGSGYGPPSSSASATRGT